MTQNINLLSSGLSKPRVGLSLATLASCLGLALLALFAAQFILQYQVGSLSAQLRGLQDSIKDQRAHAEKLTGLAAGRKPDPQIEAEIAKLDSELRQAHEAMSAL